MKPQIGWLLYLLALLLFVSAQDSIAQGEAVECAPFHAAATAAGGFCLFPDLPELNFINEIEGDGAGRIWIGTDGRGLTMWQEGELRNWQPETSEMREDAIRGFAVRNGVAVSGLFGCGGGCGGVGVYDITSDEWQHYYPEESELGTGGVGGVAIDGEGRIYMPDAFGDLHVLDGTKWQHFAAPPDREEMPLISDSTDALFDAHGTLWVSYTPGLYTLKDDEWTRVRNFPFIGIYALAYDANRDLIWAATEDGLLFGNEQLGWQATPPPFTPSESETASFPRISFEDVALGADGRVWVISRTMLSNFNGRDWEIFEPSLIDDGSIGSDNWGESLSFDNEGNLWLEYSSLGRLAVFPDAASYAEGAVLPVAEIEGVPLPPEMTTPTIMRDPIAGVRAFAIGFAYLLLGVAFLIIIRMVIIAGREPS